MNIHPQMPADYNQPMFSWELENPNYGRDVSMDDTSWQPPKREQGWFAFAEREAARADEYGPSDV
jgi:hypothetical protein